MGSQVQLHNLLLSICDNVYFQTPESYKMKYPCIRYFRNKMDTSYADNNPYNITKGYRLTVIDSRPDSSISDDVAKLSTSAFENSFRSNNLNHDVFNIYF